MFDIEELTERLGITVTDEATAKALLQLQEDAISVIEGVTGRWFGLHRPAVEVLNGSGTALLQLKTWPLQRWGPGGVQLYPVTVEVREEWADGWEVLEEFEDWELDRTHLFHREEWPKGVRNVRVSYREGVEPNGEPGPIRTAVLALVRGAYQETLQKNGTLEAETLGKYSYRRRAVQDSPWYRNALDAIGTFSIDRIG